MGTKTFKSEAESKAGVSVSTNNVRMHGNEDHYVMADERGITVSGPMSFVSGSDQIRIGGLWTMSNQLLLSLPSTMATPNPTLSINPPIKQFETIMKDAAVMIQLLGSLSAI